jgi:hypothetical protein
MALFFNTLFADTFQRANENPLNPANWAAVGSPPSFPPLQVQNNQCTPISSANFAIGAEQFTASLPNDQWAEFKISSIGALGNAQAYIRTDTHLSTGYLLAVQPRTDSHGNVIELQAVVGSILLLDLEHQSINLGDVFKVAALGNTIAVYQNGALLGSVSDSSTASGSISVSLQNNGGVITGITNFRCGSVSGGPTKGTVIQGQFVNTANNPNPVMGAFSQNNRQQLDLIQVQSRGGRVVWKLDYTGAAIVNPATWTQDTLLGQFAGASFQDAFQNYNANILQQDLIQIADSGGNVVWLLDHTGTVFSA